MIRGTYGREALKEDERIYFMNKKIVLAPSGMLQCKVWYKFEFVLEPNIGNEELIESYVGVDFSILYETTMMITSGVRIVKAIEGFFCAVNGQGIVPEIGKKAEPHNFTIDPSSLDASSIHSVPKFLFEGCIYSTNVGI
jgi:hypothetical protein